ncbi:MAG: hypothetical protein HKO68_17215, partial [Desulfobacterales bacterium]|nr:hypothetical protein [Desulfobacterales bacterium]
TQLAADKQNAEFKLSEFLEVKDQLDQKGVAQWGGKLYAEMVQFGQEADALFMDQQYSVASDKYDQAIGLAEKLASQTAEALQRLLEEGRAALVAGDGSLAQKTFNTALMIEPSNPVAHRGLKRAATIETVMQLIESGTQHEQNNDLPAAVVDYRKALRIDPAAEQARNSLTRVEGRVRENQFQHFLSDGLEALHRSDYQLARTKLLKAKSFKPKSRQVRDALSQADQALRLARIDRLQRQATSAENTEQWQSALKSYLAVLEIDKNVQFASTGKERAVEQIRITKRIDFFLQKPEILEADSHLKNAILTLNDAGVIEPQGPKLRARIEELDSLVRIAQTPVKITIESDNLTHVAVYRVGKLGRFAVRELNLRPGSYTVVGSRDGYQDVRQKLVVKPDRQPTRITVKCTVKI